MPEITMTDLTYPKRSGRMTAHLKMIRMTLDSHEEVYGPDMPAEVLRTLLSEIRRHVAQGLDRNFELNGEGS